MDFEYVFHFVGMLAFVLKEFVLRLLIISSENPLYAIAMFFWLIIWGWILENAVKGMLYFKRRGFGESIEELRFTAGRKRKEYSMISILVFVLISIVLWPDWEAVICLTSIGVVALCGALILETLWRD